jgi:antirestriction protein ArdC
VADWFGHMQQAGFFLKAQELRDHKIASPAFAVYQEETEAILASLRQPQENPSSDAQAEETPAVLRFPPQWALAHAAPPSPGLATGPGPLPPEQSPHPSDEAHVAKPSPQETLESSNGAAASALREEAQRAQAQEPRRTLRTELERVGLFPRVTQPEAPHDAMRDQPQPTRPKSDPVCELTVGSFEFQVRKYAPTPNNATDTYQVAVVREGQEILQRYAHTDFLGFAFLYGQRPAGVAQVLGRHGLKVSFDEIRDFVKGVRRTCSLVTRLDMGLSVEDWWQAGTRDRDVTVRVGGREIPAPGSENTQRPSNPAENSGLRSAALPAATSSLQHDRVAGPSAPPEAGTLSPERTPPGGMMQTDRPDEREQPSAGDAQPAALSEQPPTSAQAAQPARVRETQAPSVRTATEPSSKKTQGPDVYARVTNSITEAIERGHATFQMPWHVSGAMEFPVNVASQLPYRGANVLCLWASAQKQSFEGGLWGTYRQWAELGAQVRKHERGTPIVYWRVEEKDAKEHEAQDPKEPTKKPYFIAKAYTVFHASQVEGFTPPQTPTLAPAERIARAEEFFRGLGADVRHGYTIAAYVPQRDYIKMPNYEHFTSPDGYYSVLAHEITHWTGASDRLARDLTGRHGEQGYAMEELVAELGAAFQMAKLGVSVEPRPDHAGYVQGWLDLLKSDKRAIFAAAGKAQEAVDWLEKQHELVRGRDGGQERER